MQQIFISNVKTLLKKLRNGEGYFIIQNVTSNSKKDVNVFCQFLNMGDGNIRFEAVSHNFEPGLDPALESGFKALGFTLEKGANYYKNIRLNSDDLIRQTVSEVITIFEEIYLVDENSEYSFEEGN